MGSGSDIYWKNKKRDQEVLAKSDRELGQLWVERNKAELGTQKIIRWEEHGATEHIFDVADALTCPAILTGMQADEVRDLFLTALGKCFREFNR